MDLDGFDRRRLSMIFTSATRGLKPFMKSRGTAPAAFSRAAVFNDYSLLGRSDGWAWHKNFSDAIVMPFDQSGERNAWHGFGMNARLATGQCDLPKMEKPRMNKKPALLATAAIAWSSAALADPVKILFVGNSYTFGRIAGALMRLCIPSQKKSRYSSQGLTH